MQPGMIASGTIEAVMHGMDAQPMLVKKVETTAQSTSMSGSIATRIPQDLLRNVVVVEDNRARGGP